MTFELHPSDFSRWLEAYKAAWEQRDPDRAAALFTEGASYRETPFEPALGGQGGIRDYWAKAVAGQKDITFTYEVFACNGPHGICRWHATFTAVPGGETIDLDGIFRCRFVCADRVEALEEWWHVKVTEAAIA